VFIQVREDAFEARPVTLGATSGALVEVRSGVGPAEKVVVRGGFAVKSEMLADLLAE
jgi:hypothetical protein